LALPVAMADIWPGAQLIRRPVTEGTGEIDRVLGQKESIRSGHQ